MAINAIVFLKRKPDNLEIAGGKATGKKEPLLKKLRVPVPPQKRAEINP
jgi:hypothetical protein